jgi:hypothetical protein
MCRQYARESGNLRNTCGEIHVISKLCAALVDQKMAAPDAEEKIPVRG